jgi:hypothetical protein
VTVVLVAAVAGLGAGVAAGSQGGARLITVLSKTAKEQVAEDKAPAGDSKGDVIAGSSILRNAVAQFGKAKGAVVGRDQYRMVLETPNANGIHVTVTLPGGTLTCQGTLFRNRARQVLRAVQGTGAFAHATGTCEATAAPKNPYGADTLNAYRLQVP